jgi:uncharacterized membrane protein
MTELNVFLFVTNICVVLLCGALFPIVPMLTRKSFLFGVKVPPEAQDTNEARELKKNYMVITIIGALIVLAGVIWQYAVAPDYTVYGMMFFPLALIAAQFAAFAPNHSKALKFKARLGWNVADIHYADTRQSFTRGNLSDMPRFWYIIAIIVIFIFLVIAFVRYPALPDRVPTHWGIDGQLDGWSNKSVGTLLALPVINFAMLVIIWLTGIMVERAKLQIDHREPEKSFAQHRKYRRIMGHGIGLLALAMVVMLALIDMQTLFEGFTIPIWVALAVILVPTISVCVISVKAGQGGTLLKVNTAEIKIANGDIAGNNAMSDDKYWAWGMFYHNPDDPACLVGNRFGGNIGFNYSRLPVKIGVAIGFAVLAAGYVWMIALFQTLI